MWYMNVILYFVVGFILVVIDQAVAPNDENALVFVMWLLWPGFLALHLANWIVKGMLYIGTTITLLGVKLRIRIRQWQIDRKDKYNEEKA